MASNITKTECLNLLFELKDSGIECTEQIKHLLSISEPDIETIKFINDNKELNIRKFYEKLRKSYNNKHSKLYINIVKEDELEPKELICCLGALLQQVLLFNKTIEDREFLKQARFNEILLCLGEYYKDGNIIPSQKLLKLFKSDLKLLELISKQ